MTIREFLWRRVKRAMVVQAMTFLVAVIAGFALPEMANVYAVIVVVLFGFGVVLSLLYQTRCPECAYPIAMSGAANLRQGAGIQRINYCPHCGISLDVTYGSKAIA